MQMNHDITIQDVFHRFLPRYCETHNFSPQQQLTALCISKCHTLEMGANLNECESCHKKYIHYIYYFRFISDSIVIIKKFHA